MDLAEAVSIAHTLSEPSKMPWYGYSIPASTCKIGAKFAKVKGTTCNICYALKGRYVFPNVQEAMHKRFRSLPHPQWVEAMTVQLTHYSKRYKFGTPAFRWHDSGDLQGLWHLNNIVEVAENTPHIIHWLPTREVPTVRAFLEQRQFPPNLSVKISSSLIGKQGSRPVEGLGVTTVGRDEDSSLFQCDAYDRGGKCGPCRTCWTNKDVNMRAH